MEFRFSPLHGHTEGKVSGYVCRWGIPSNVNGIGPELFERGALKPGTQPVVVYLQHDKKRLLGSSRKGTLKLTEDETGLLATVQLPKSAEDVKELVSRGDLGGFSAGFLCLEDYRLAGERRIKRAELNEISLVDRPAHSGTEVQLRNKKQKVCLSDLEWSYV